MKAWVLQKVGEIAYRETDIPKPQDTEVLVRVRAAGICGSDIPRIFRDGAHTMPLIPGHEFAGEVADLGRRADKRWLHKRVGVYPLLPCFACASCRAGRHEMCARYGYLGSRQDGGFAEYVAVPQDNLIGLPENVTYEQAAMLEPLSVAVHALRRIRIGQDDTVAVCGMGTIGMLLTMLLLARGFRRVYALGNKDHQRAKAAKIGLPEAQFIDVRTAQAAETLMCGNGHAGADVFFECVGRNETILQALRLTAPGGSVCLVGNPASDVSLDKQSYWKILRSQLHITGTWNSSFFTAYGDGGAEVTDWQYALSCLEQGRIAPERLITHRFPPERLDEGLRIMRDKSEDYIKIMEIFS